MREINKAGEGEKKSASDRKSDRKRNGDEEEKGVKRGGSGMKRDEEKKT